MSISPCPGRPIAGSTACRRAAVSSSRSASRARSGRIPAAATATAARAISTAYFVSAEGGFEADAEEFERLRAAFDAGGLDTVRSLIWRRPALPDRCWFVGKDWALSRDDTP
jgi:protein-L-isoaspartate(D-aspartate) O-methyltransferase